ncbi:MAG: hypothetical protein ACYCPD_11790 [Acidobacteriaceae bacterium]
MEPFHSVCLSLTSMERLYGWPWVEAQVAQTIEVWNAGAARTMSGGQPIVSGLPIARLLRT